MPKKSRRPYDFGYNDYLDWTKWLKTWLNDHSGDPDYPSHLIAEYDAAVVAYEAALIDYKAKKEAPIGKSELYDAKSKAVYDKLLTIKIALPTVVEEPDVLSEFGLSSALSRDREDVYVLVQVVLGRWAVVSADPVYAPMVADFNELILLSGEFTSAHDDYYSAYDAMQQAQNALVAAKETLSQAERKIFTWYRSRYTKGTEEFWTGTPWGASGGGSGGGGEEPGGEVPEIPDKPEGVYANFMTEPVTAMLVGCGKYGEHTGFDVVRAVTPAGVTETPTRPEELFATNIDVINEPLLDTDIDPGYRYWYWVRARNGDEVGEWSEVVWVEYL